MKIPVQQCSCCMDRYAQEGQPGVEFLRSGPAPWDPTIYQRVFLDEASAKSYFEIHRSAPTQRFDNGKGSTAPEQKCYS